jgi:hypothetical protein
VFSTYRKHTASQNLEKMRKGRFIMALSMDPRPDLAEDSALWSLLLEIARGTNLQLAANLHGFRCIGTRLKRNRKWGLVMEPILPGKGAEAGARAKEAGITTSDVTGWQDRDDYKAASQKYLRPYHKELLELFRMIG